MIKFFKKFEYTNRVKIVSGFYKGQIGLVVGYSILLGYLVRTDNSATGFYRAFRLEIYND